jgi:hypothetical protein
MSSDTMTTIHCDVEGCTASFAEQYGRLRDGWVEMKTHTGKEIVTQHKCPEHAALVATFPAAAELAELRAFKEKFQQAFGKLMSVEEVAERLARARDDDEREAQATMERGEAVAVELLAAIRDLASALRGTPVVRKTATMETRKPRVVNGVVLQPGPDDCWAGPSGVRLWFCGGPQCPGLPWKATEHQHPSTCVRGEPEP